MPKSSTEENPVFAGMVPGLLPSLCPYFILSHVVAQTMR